MFKVIVYTIDRRKPSATLALLPDYQASIIRRRSRLTDTHNGNVIDAAQCWRDGGTLAQVIETLLSIEYAYRYARIAIEDYRIPQGGSDDTIA